MAIVTRDEFETVKELLMSAARYAESANERLDRVAVQQELNAHAIAGLTQKQDQTQQQLDQLGARLEDAQQRTQLQLDQLGARVNQLSDSVFGLAEQLEQQAQIAEQDRNQAAIDRAEFRSTVTQLLQVLTQQMNGNGRSGD